MKLGPRSYSQAQGNIDREKAGLLQGVRTESIDKVAFAYSGLASGDSGRNNGDGDSARPGNAHYTSGLDVVIYKLQRTVVVS